MKQRSIGGWNSDGKTPETVKESATNEALDEGGTQRQKNEQNSYEVF